MAEPLKSPDPTTLPADQVKGDSHVESLRKAYDKHAEEVRQTPPGTPEHFKAMQAKQASFLKYKEAADAKAEADTVTAVAEQKQQAAESAARDAQAAKKAAADAAKATKQKP